MRAVRGNRLRVEAARGIFGTAHVEDERILAHRAVNIHGKSRAQVLESGGRVDKGTLAKPGTWMEPTTADVKLRTALAVIQSGLRGTQAKCWESLKPRMPWLAPPSIPVRER